MQKGRFADIVGQDIKCTLFVVDYEAVNGHGWTEVG
jgi:hypothetical protein